MESPRFIIEAEHVLGHTLQREYSCPLCEKLKNGLTSLCIHVPERLGRGLDSSSMRSTCTREHIRLSTQRFPREQRAGDLEFRFIVAILDLCLT
jgi:hypothetical protein